MGLGPIAWIDIETTGLDPKEDIILEVGVIITDATPQFHEISTRSWVIHVDAEVLREANPWAQVQHRASGLFGEATLSHYTIQDVERAALAYLAEHDAFDSPMAGSSPHFDRSFLVEDMPALHKAFHYRNFDVSTLKTMLAIQGYPVPAKRDVHRVLEDLRDSVGLAKYFASILGASIRSLCV